MYETIIKEERAQELERKEDYIEWIGDSKKNCEDDVIIINLQILKS